MLELRTAHRVIGTVLMFEHLSAFLGRVEDAAGYRQAEDRCLVIEPRPFYSPHTSTHSLTPSREVRLLRRAADLIPIALHHGRVGAHLAPIADFGELSDDQSFPSPEKINIPMCLFRPEVMQCRDIFEEWSDGEVAVCVERGVLRRRHLRCRSFESLASHSSRVVCEVSWCIRGSLGAQFKIL